MKYSQASSLSLLLGIVLLASTATAFLLQSGDVVVFSLLAGVVASAVGVIYYRAKALNAMPSDPSEMMEAFGEEGLWGKGDEDNPLSEEDIDDILGEDGDQK